MPSEFTRYWSRIDNCPGPLERLSTKQAAEVKEMVKAAFHANTHHYRQRIKELEAENTTLRKYNHLCKAHWESPEDPCSDNVGCTICQTNRAIKAEARLDAVSPLPYKWRPKGNGYFTEYEVALVKCADELKAALEQKDVGT